MFEWRHRNDLAPFNSVWPGDGGGKPGEWILSGALR